MFGANHHFPTVLEVDGHPISDNRLHLADPPLRAVGMADTHAGGEFR